jgi:hypothetical protein
VKNSKDLFITAMFCSHKAKTSANLVTPAFITSINTFICLFIPFGIRTKRQIKSHSKICNTEKMVKIDLKTSLEVLKLVDINKTKDKHNL